MQLPQPLFDQNSSEVHLNVNNNHMLFFSNETQPLEHLRGEIRFFLCGIKVE